MYRPGIINDASLQTLAASLRAELSRIALEFAQPADYLALNTIYAEPGRVIDGMLVKADGSAWNPGSGAGVYVRQGSSWIKL